MNLSPNAQSVLEARYLRRDSTGQICETPEQLFARVARAVAHAELLLGNASQAAMWEERFFNLMLHLDFLPNSPTLMNAGTPLGQLSACFVLPVEDTMESIFGAVRDMALVQRTGGGTGFTFGHLRPSGDLVRSTGGAASGPVSFMQIFDCATEHIKQGGKRRGANMGILPVDHPDILEFIHVKRSQNVLNNFNLSVGVTDLFMASVDLEDDFELRHPADGHVVSRLKARELFDQIVEAAWEVGDPGMIFLDTINGANPTPAIGKIEATNPCGEVPLLPHESCNLGSINLARFILDENDTPQFDWTRLATIVQQATRFLDDVITVNRYPLPEIEGIALGNRKVGLGVMGFAEVLLRLGISYRSERAVSFGRRVMHVISSAAKDASTMLAEERGVFSNWPQSVYARKNEKRRNATLTSIAPTGTISIIADTTSSIEPLFALSYRRVGVLGHQTLTEFNPLLIKLGERQGWLTQSVLDQVGEVGSLGGCEEVPVAFRDLFATALEIPAEQHLRIQATFQELVDNAVSKTVNLPADATAVQVGEIYREAHRIGTKGITIYRYGSLSNQVLQLGAGEEPYEKEHSSKCDPYQCRL